MSERFVNLARAIRQDSNASTCYMHRMELGASLELDELLPLALERMRSAAGASGTLWMVEAEGMVAVAPARRDRHQASGSAAPMDGG